MRGKPSTRENRKESPVHTEQLRTVRQIVRGRRHISEREDGPYPEWCEEPLVLPSEVPLLQQLLDHLLRILPLRWFFEGFLRD